MALRATKLSRAKGPNAERSGAVLPPRIGLRNRNSLRAEEIAYSGKSRAVASLPPTSVTSEGLY